MDDLTRAGRPDSFKDKLRYVADMSGELAAIAGALRQPMLTYFLNMARVEAEMRMNEVVVRPQQQRRRSTNS